MPEAPNHCPLCKEPGPFVPFFTYIHKTRPENRWVLCPVCGDVFVSPRPTQEELDRYYAAAYREQVQGTAQPQSSNLNEESIRANRLHWFIRRFLPKVERHLDIGSSAGLLLAEIQSDYKCESYGIEPGDAFRDFADEQIREAGRHVKFYRTLNEAPDWSYDLITISHVLEHMTDPLGYLDNLVNHYIPDGGHLMIEVPNLFGEPTALIYPHMVAFCHETLWTTINKVGLTPIEIETSQPGFRHPVSPPPYLTAMSRKGNIDIVEDYRARHKAMLHEAMTMGRIQQRMEEQAKESNPSNS